MPGFAGVAMSAGGVGRRHRGVGRRRALPVRRSRLPVLARRTAAAGLTGFEWAVGVPGSIGGAVRMNAGGHGSDIAACIARAEIFDLHSQRLRVASGRLARVCASAARTWPTTRSC